jgi:hypothetical protein
MKMSEHYFEAPLTHDEVARIKSAVRGGFKLTPAQVEQNAVVNETNDGTIDAMETTARTIRFKPG